MPISETRLEKIRFSLDDMIDNALNGPKDSLKTDSSYMNSEASSSPQNSIINENIKFDKQKVDSSKDEFFGMISNATLGLSPSEAIATRTVQNLFAEERLVVNRQRPSVLNDSEDRFQHGMKIGEAIMFP
jgi:hypothetical protein